MDFFKGILDNILISWTSVFNWWQPSLLTYTISNQKWVATIICLEFLLQIAQKFSSCFTQKFLVLFRLQTKKLKHDSDILGVHLVVYTKWWFKIKNTCWHHYGYPVFHYNHSLCKIHEYLCLSLVTMWNLKLINLRYLIFFKYG